jgi:hypothetical protein
MNPTTKFQPYSESYKIYGILEYDFDSQSKVGRKIFTKLGLGKKYELLLKVLFR